jgi:hypothetical protein
MSRPDDAGFDEVRTNSRAVDPAGLLMPAIDFSEGVWQVYRGRNDLAEQCLQRCIESASSRQLGEIAASAASLLIALRLIELNQCKFEMLNPLLRVRLDNMPQLTELLPAYMPTPFSDWSPRPEPSFYDSHLMACVVYFNSLPRAPGASNICNPLQAFDSTVENLINWSCRAGGRLPEGERKRAAVVGTSIKPYHVLRNHLFYRYALFGWNPPNLPGMDAYAKLPSVEQLRVLRFVDSEQFQIDLRAHRLDSSGHSDYV